MSQKLRIAVIVVILFPITCLCVNAQVNVFSKNVLDGIKDGHTHIVVDSVNLNGEALLNVFKKYWTITKGVDVVSNDDLQGGLVLGDTYFALGTQYATYSNGTTVMDMFLGLWTPKERAVRKHKDFSSNSENLLGSVTLTMNLHPKRVGPSTDGTGALGYWTPGNLKNFLQELQLALQTGKKTKATDDVTAKEQLKLLQGQTLYCSPDVFYQPKPDEDQTGFIRETFEDYKFDYSVISPSDLSDKILADKEPFYYLVHLHNSIAGKIIAVINSRTGQLVYLRQKISFSAHIKSGDLKELDKEIN